MRELERQIDWRLFEQRGAQPAKTLTSAERNARCRRPASHFKDAYVLEFLDLPAGHTEADLHRGLLRHSFARFLIELGRDFCFVGSRVSRCRWVARTSRSTCCSSIAA